MSERKLSSRREAEEFIAKGFIFVNGIKVIHPSTKISRADNIQLRVNKTEPNKITVILNKPIGYVSSQPEGKHQAAISLINPYNRSRYDRSKKKFRRTHLRGLASAGRLDFESTGLLVFTQDGVLAKRLIGQDSQVEKEYLVRVKGAVTKDKLKVLSYGLELDGIKLKPSVITQQNESQLKFILREGKKRQIRRMCSQVELRVQELKRVRIGALCLGPLEQGKWRYLNKFDRF